MSQARPSRRSPDAGPGAAPGPRRRTTSAPNGPFGPLTRTGGVRGLTFGAICPKKGKGAGLVMPYADTEAMTAHLAEISAHVDLGAHAVVILDQAGWHMSRSLEVPDNITLLPLLPRAPELNPVENIWQFLRDNSCATTGSPTGSSTPTTTSWPTAAMPGTS